MIVRQEGGTAYSAYRETESKQTERTHAAERKIVSDLAPTAHIRQVAWLAKEHEPVDHRLVLIAKVGPAEDLSSPRLCQTCMVHISRQKVCVCNKYCLVVLPGAQILLGCAPGSTKTVLLGCASESTNTS